MCPVSPFDMCPVRYVPMLELALLKSCTTCRIAHKNIRLVHEHGFRYLYPDIYGGYRRISAGILIFVSISVSMHRSEHNYYIKACL